MTASNSSAADFDVAIVGYGPVGALSALLLASADLRVTILERAVDPLELPRAVRLDGESLRMFQRIGYGRAIADLLQPPREREEIQFTNSKREKYFSAPFDQFGSNGWRDIAFFDQPELEARLREFVAREQRIEVRMGQEVTQLNQDSEGVDLKMVRVDSGETSSLRAAWVLGCDGASSLVRRAVGIDWTSLGYDQDWLVVDITQKPEADLPLVSMQVCDPERLVSYICVKDPNRRWELQLLPGDAAHQTPPVMGQGLNAGFRDAANLGWNFPLWCGG